MSSRVAAWPPSATLRVGTATHGHPLALALVADLPPELQTEDFRLEAAPDVVRSLLDCFMRSTPTPEHRRALYLCVTVIATTEGPVAIEDLVPGMAALTGEGRAERITWIDSMTLFPPHALPGMPRSPLTRITADAFGIGRPMPDLVLGPRARVRRCFGRSKFSRSSRRQK